MRLGLVRASAITRRGLVAAGAGLLATSCARVALRSVARSAVSVSDSAAAPSMGPFPFVVSQGTSQDRAAFASFDPKVQVLAAPHVVTPAGQVLAAEWGVTDARPYSIPAAFAPLDEAMRQVNFSASTLLPGALDAFADTRGRHYGVPVGAVPYAVAYNIRAFHDAGIQVPGPDWTIDDFEKTCAAMAAAISAQKVTGVSVPVAPLLGGTGYTTLGKPGVTQWPGAFTNADLWGAFVLGYGGLVVQNGRYDLTTKGALEGLGRIVEISRLYAPPRTFKVTSLAQFFVSVLTAALSFTLLGSSSSFVGGQGPLGFLRFPRLPVHAVVPAQLQGVGLSSTATPSHPSAFNPASVPVQAPEAVVEYALWRFHEQRTNPGLPHLTPPALGDADVQNAYWGAAGAPIVDWKNYAFVQVGWPPTAIPPGVASPVYEALTEAANEGTPLPGLLAKATQQLNNSAQAAAKQAAKTE